VGFWAVEVPPSPNAQPQAVAAVDKSVKEIGSPKQTVKGLAEKFACGSGPVLIKAGITIVSVQPPVVVMMSVTVQLPGVV
jgi:hypothetical protein